MIRYIPWETKDLGITFNMRKRRIAIFKKTLEAIHFPEYCHFLFNTTENTFAIQACRMDDEGAHRLAVDFEKKYRCEVNCTSLVRLVYQTCGWRDRNSYRIIGVPRPKQQLVKFDLKLAQTTSEEKLPIVQTGSGKIVSVKFPAR